MWDSTSKVEIFSASVIHIFTFSAATTNSSSGGSSSSNKTISPNVMFPSVDQSLEWALWASKQDLPHDAAEEKRMKQRLKLFNLHEVPVSGDGNCQFSAISHQLFGDFNHSTQLRRISVEWLRKHPNWTPVRFSSPHDENDLSLMCHSLLKEHHL